MTQKSHISVTMASALDMSRLLDQLNESLELSTQCVPQSEMLDPPSDGISLFDTKNELFLSYLHNLVFLILLKIRSFRGEEGDCERVTHKLVELRLYLEKGVRPLESKLQYQLDKLLAAAAETGPVPKPSIGHGDIQNVRDPSELTYRPNPAALMTTQDSGPPAVKSGVYKPPRITPTALPTTDPRGQKTSRPRKSQAVDNFIREELTDAPVAEPNIGAGDGLRGRDRERALERQEYEEQRLMRLPEEKKGKGMRKRHVGDGAEDLDIGFGGRLGATVDFGSHARVKRKGTGATSRKMGESWAKRVKKGIRGKRA